MSDIGIALSVATIGIGLMSIAGVWALSIFKSPMAVSNEIAAKVASLDTRLTTLEIEYARSHATLSTLVEGLRSDIAELKVSVDRFIEQVHKGSPRNGRSAR